MYNFDLKGKTLASVAVTAYLVSVVIPVYNEQKYIEKCIFSIINQDFDKNKMEAIFVDGNSEDETKNIILSYAEKFPFIKVIDNPRRKIPCALNIGVKASKGSYIVRMDAHSEYASNYISKSIEYLEKTGANNVGGPMVAKGKTPVQKAIAAAYHSNFALGGGKFHDENYEGYADTVFLGTFKKETLISVGLYDENILFAEDDDLNYRIIEGGGKIYVTPEIKSFYYPRSNYKDLFKQYFNYGLWKVAVIKKHKRPARISHLIPVSFVLFLIFGAISSIFSNFFGLMFLSVLSLYFALNFYFSFSNRYAQGITNKLRLVLINPILHTAYGTGFLVGIFRFLGVLN